MAVTDADGPQTRPPTAGAISLREALAFWCKLGFISFGGPAGQIALMHRELVERRRWISDGRFMHALQYCMVLPGPEAQQLATYLGWLMHRTAGGVAAGVLFVLPSLFILIALSWAYLALGHLPAVAAFFAGVRPAVAAVVLHAVWRLGGRTLGTPRQRPVLWALALAAFLAIAGLDLPFPAVMLGAALVGWWGSRGARGLWPVGAVAAAPAARGGPPACIDDHTPPPAHARRSRSGLLRVALAGFILWLLPMALLVAQDGMQGVLATMGRFFTQAALVTFGGAYAVLPYVHQGAVEQQQWLTAAQMIDGLALGESTPGPLIMVVAFVGFVGGWTRDVLGWGWPVLSGAAGALVATWFTFLPSFLFILAGGPWVESSRARPGWSAPLVAISAAVVGVMASLGVFLVGLVAFGQALWAGAPLGVDWVALGLMGLALAVLARGRVGVIPVLLASGSAGVLWRLAGAGGGL